MQKFPYKVIAPEAGREGTFNVSIHVEVNDDQPANNVLHYMRGIELKNDFMNSWMREKAPGYGLEIKGGPRPVFAGGEGARDTAVVAYEQDYRLTRPI